MSYDDILKHLGLDIYQFGQILLVKSEHIFGGGLSTGCGAPSPCLLSLLLRWSRVKTFSPRWSTDFGFPVTIHF